MKELNSFHLAIPVNNLEVCKDFYQNVLECKPGRHSKSWADYNFFGHQLVIHLNAKKNDRQNFNTVDGHEVPIPHFGVVLGWDEWLLFSDKITKLKIKFVIKPYIRFKGKVGEQATMFFLDPSGNALEFKSFKNPNQLFKK